MHSQDNQKLSLCFFQIVKEQNYYTIESRLNDKHTSKPHTHTVQPFHVLAVNT